MNKDYRKLLDLYHEFDQFLCQIHGFYLDSVAGFESLVRHIENEQEYYQKLFEGNDELSSTEFLNKLNFSHFSFTGKDYAASGIHFTTTGEVKKRNARNGKNQQFLGAMCLVLLYSYWETYFRKKLASALGVKSIDLAFPIWGDLRILRHCILHKKHITDKDIKKIQVLKWFQDGEEIVIDEGKFRKVFLGLLSFRNWIHAQSLPKRTITIPIKS